jgi:hypothetical protein
VATGQETDPELVPEPTMGGLVLVTTDRETMAGQVLE